jgi:microcystin-dependent protein
MDPFVAEIRIFGFNFAPTGWAQCNGQLLPISQNTALFSLLGTYYGGDGKSTFALPNLEGSVPTHQGQGPGLQEWFLGELQGSETITLLTSEIPFHTHAFQALNANGTSADPSGAVLAKGFYDVGAQTGAAAFYQTTAVNVAMNPQAIGVTGASFPHNNMMPFLVLNYCIAMQGVFPPRQ